MKCHNCPKNALYVLGPEGKEFALCLDCYVKLANTQLREEEAMERHLNQLYGEMEMISGVQGLFPRFPERRTIVHTGELTLNNIHVSNSEIGVLNTGHVETIDNTLTVLKSEGNEIAGSIQELSETVIKTGDLTPNQKNEVLELLCTLSEEAATPNENRKLAVVKAVLTQLSDLLGGVASLAQVYEKARSVIQSVFGI